MGGDVLMFVALMTAAATIWAGIFVTWPAAARARFIADLSELRDDVDDAVIDGRLPEVPAVRNFLAGTSTLLAEPEHVSLTLVSAIHWTYLEHGVRLQTTSPNYGGLTPQQRKLMHAFDRRESEILTRRLEDGSCLAALFKILRVMLPLARRLNHNLQTPPPPRQLAREFQRLPEQKQYLCLS